MLMLLTLNAIQYCGQLAYATSITANRCCSGFPVRDGMEMSSLLTFLRLY